MPSPASASAAAYSPAERLLHRLALSWRPVMETSFDLESARFGKAADAVGAVRPIFVCGLARAGTSLATRLIAAAAGMAFPSYRDMPFPLAPNLWARLSGKRRSVAATERGHGDGLVHHLDTPEAIEEAFWRCFEGPHYLRHDGIAATPPAARTLERFRRYMALVTLRAGGARYLSKNNNNLVRVDALAQAFPDALFVHPFRHPSAQAASLCRQHRRACDLQRQDRFRQHYADWLAHHEFGLGQRPFLLPGSPPPAGDRRNRDYWLAAWDGAYRHLLGQPEAVRERQFFLDHDSLCRSPEPELSALARFLGIEEIGGDIVAGVTDQDELEAFPPSVAETYRRLLERRPPRPPPPPSLGFSRRRDRGARG